MNKKIVRILISPIIGLSYGVKISLFYPIIFVGCFMAIFVRAFNKLLLYCSPNYEPDYDFYNPSQICEFSKSPTINYILTMFIVVWIIPYQTYRYAKFGEIFQI